MWPEIVVIIRQVMRLLYDEYSFINKEDCLMCNNRKLQGMLRNT